MYTVSFTAIPNNLSRIKIHKAGFPHAKVIGASRVRPVYNNQTLLESMLK